MKSNKFFNAIIFASAFLVNSAMAASSEDFESSQGACLVAFNDVKSFRYINVEYIRLIYIENETPKVIKMSMASNYYNGNTDKFAITYETEAEAQKVFQELSEKINNCQYNTLQKRKKK